MAEEGVKLFGEDGLIFDHTNPLDYLSFVPGIGVLGVGAKVLSTLAKANRLKKFPKTQYHGGHANVEKGEAARRGIYTSPDSSYANAWKFPRGEDAVEKFGPTGLYKLDLSTLKNFELLDKPSKKLKQAIKKELDRPIIPYGSPGHEAQKKLNHGLTSLFNPQYKSPSMEGVEGGRATTAGREALDWLRRRGVEAITGSPTLKRGLKGKSGEGEYFLLKDFPKKKLSEVEIDAVLAPGRAALERAAAKIDPKKLKAFEEANNMTPSFYSNGVPRGMGARAYLNSKAGRFKYNEGGEVSNNLQNFLAVATEAIELERAEAPTEMPKDYRDGGRVRLI